VVAGLLWASNAGALPLRAPTTASTSTGTIAYQGRLADADGNPLTGTYNMIFRLYDVASGGVPLWTEQWTGSNGVQVSDGLFNVMLGSLTQLPQNVITDHDTLWLGITVGTDDEMEPRVQLGTVPFAVQALTVPDGAVTTAKIADGAVTTAKIADKTITSRKVAPLYKSGVIWESFSSTAVNTWEDTGLQISFAASDIPVDGVVFVFATTSGRHSAAGGRWLFRLPDGTRPRATVNLTSGASQQWQATGLMAEFTVSANTAYTFKLQMQSPDTGTHMTQADSKWERIVGIYFAN